MSESRSSTATAVIIALLTANLAVSAYIALGPRSAVPHAQSKAAADAASAVGSSEAQALAARVVPIFNAGDTHALYEMFDPLARVQMTEADVAEKFGNLDKVIGKVDEFVFSHATVEGEQGGRTFYKLIYKVRLSGGPFAAGDLSLTVFRNGESLGLYGFYINGTTGTASS